MSDLHHTYHRRFAGDRVEKWWSSVVGVNDAYFGS